MSCWKLRSVPFKYQLSDWTLLSIPLNLQCRSVPLFGEPATQAIQIPPSSELEQGSQGFMIRALPVVDELPKLSRQDGYLCYVPLQYEHCYIDLTLTLETYQKKFSSKTRSTINRKIRKYAEHCGGTINWRKFETPEQVREFFTLARSVSKLSYQERLLDAGLPDSEAFIQQAEVLAAENRLRAYILFDGERPVSYLYCPVEQGVLIYAYLGYDPEYMKLSVGTVLQWLALESLFGEACFTAFDFTEGQSDHKRLFATHQTKRANVFLVKASLRSQLIIHSHLRMDQFSGWLGVTLDRLGVRAKVKRLLRFGR
ncbi:MAG: GNAT family N-acetyltransferase [Proteobacteria bacterium]|nr:GNAT family N-acetyltransferase [Pseudomonadota bacterium]